MVDTKLALLAAALALIDAIIPMTLGYASLQFSSLPSTPSLLLLAGLVKLLLLLLPTSFIRNPTQVDTPLSTKGSFCSSDSESSGGTLFPGGRPDSPTRGHDQTRPKGEVVETAPSSAVFLDVQQFDKQRRPAPSRKRQSSPTPDGTPSKQGGSSHSSSWHWPMLLGSAVCSTVAANISLSLIPEAAPFAWSQLALLQVIAAACLTFSLGDSSSRGNNRPGLSSMALGALAALFLAVLVGQGVFGGQPESLTAGPETDSLLLQMSQHPAAAAQLPPLHLVAWSLLAACLSTLGMRLLLLARHAGYNRSHASSQQELCIVQCILAVACNFVWYLLKEGSLDSFFDDITSSHEHAILLLGVSGLLSTAIACWPAADAVAASAYAHQASVMLAAWGSGLVLGLSQDGQFACSSFAAGMAVLLLHMGMQPEPQGAPRKARHSADMQAWLHGELKARRFNLRGLKSSVSASWAGLTLGLLVVTCWGQVSRSKTSFSFSHPSSAAAMARLGIVPSDLSACSNDAPFPAAQLYASSIVAAERAVADAEALNAALMASYSAAAAAAAGTAATTAAGSTAAALQGGDTTSQGQAPAPAIPSPAELARAAAAPAPAWDLCPALNCSRDASCTAQNVSCCSHLFLHMASFWDSFMHSLSLADHYTVLYDTLTDALDKGAPAPNAGEMHLGVSAQALAVLERPCVKSKLWQHGYALFLQGSAWHLCPHRQHPHPIFTSQMYPVRHLMPHTAAGSVKLHVMWPYKGENSDEQPLTAVESALASGIMGVRGRAAISTWRLCSTGEVLSMTGGVYASLEGLRLPRPLGAELSLNSGSWASPEAASPPANRLQRMTCEKLVSQLLAHLQA